MGEPLYGRPKIMRTEGEAPNITLPPMQPNIVLPEMAPVINLPNPDVKPTFEVNVPPLQQPNIEVKVPSVQPNVTVNVPPLAQPVIEFKMPEIKIPDVIIPPIIVPETIVNLPPVAPAEVKLKADFTGVHIHVLGDNSMRRPLIDSVVIANAEGEGKEPITFLPVPALHQGLARNVYANPADYEDTQFMPKMAVLKMIQDHLKTTVTPPSGPHNMSKEVRDYVDLCLTGAYAHYNSVFVTQTYLGQTVNNLKRESQEQAISSTQALTQRLVELQKQYAELMVKMAGLEAELKAVKKTE